MARLEPLCPATSEAGARRQLEQCFMSYLSNYFCCSTLVLADLLRRFPLTTFSKNSWKKNQKKYLKIFRESFNCYYYKWRICVTAGICVGAICVAGM
jgi:hypothetical protein